MAQLHILQETKILNAPRRANDYLLSDGGNLYLRVRPGPLNDRRDGKDWWFRYQLAGKTTKIGLGSYVDLSTREAREKAAALRKQILNGINPKKQREAEAAVKKITDLLPQTVAELYGEWKASSLVDRKDGGKEVERMFKLDVLPIVGTMPIQALSRRDISTLLDRVKKRGAKRVAGMLLGELRLLVNYAVARELMPGDITATLKAEQWDGQSKKRKRYLSEEEIGELHARLRETGMKPSTVAAIWIMMGTLCRVGALSRARWEDIDFDRGVWSAARKSRDEEQYAVYLSPFVLGYFRMLKADQDTLIERKRARGEAIDMTRYEWVFPAKNPRPEGEPLHVDEKSLSKQIYNFQHKKQMKNRPPALGQLRLKKGRWTAHDLRRTGSTLMAKGGVPERIRELCLNHVSQNPLNEIYDQHTYAGEMQRAWVELGERLEGIQRAAGSAAGIKEACLSHQ